MNEDNARMREDAMETSHQVTDGLDPYLSARYIIRLTQCTQCSRPLRLPVRLPCGNAVCRSCLPPAHHRDNITYPSTEGREKGFHCPFTKDVDMKLGALTCGAEHALGDCGVDVTLNKTLEIIEDGIKTFDSLDSPAEEGNEARMFITSHPREARLDEPGPMPLPCRPSRLSATYSLARRGELPCTAHITYNAKGEDQHSVLASRDKRLFDHIKESLRGELDCQVCYSLILDPCTTSCGHTFCRACVARVLDHSNLCPICRQKLPMAAFVQSEPINSRLSSIVSQFFSSEYAARLDAARKDELGSPDQPNVPLFVCTLSFPTMRTYLHIFEPRYRLMIRRALHSGNRKFGMVLFNSSGSPQGELGYSQFMQYGTMVEIHRFEMLPDGRCLISTTGLYKFKILQSSVLDGYHLGQVERVDDIPITMEENIEAQETSSAPIESQETQLHLESRTTQQLFQYAQDFVKERRTDEAPWLHDRVIAAYGGPPSDPATFPYWFATVLPISQGERYALLPTTSVRERLKITARWIQKLDNQEWYVYCTRICKNICLHYISDGSIYCRRPASSSSPWAVF